MAPRARVLLLGAGIGAGLLAARLRRGSRRGPVRATTPAGRAAVVAEQIVRTGGGYAADQARKLFADADRRRQIDADRHLETVEQVAVVMGDMKGALMKLGQMASFIDPEVLPETREVLGRLQQDVPPMAPELAAGVVAGELGARPEVVFAEWDPVPIAAASIGQVHRALTHDGRAVAVKVQYPGVDDAVRSDLDLALVLFRGARLRFPGADVGAVLEEVRVRIAEEVDYRIEAANQERFASAYAGHPHIHVPAVHRDLSAQRVLTTDLVVGERMDAAVRWSQAERDLASETIFRFVFGSLYRLGAFNGDPHPGNYLLHGGGRVTFLDFGLVKTFTAAELAPLSSMARAQAEGGGPAGFRRAIESAGFLPTGLEVSDQDVADYFGHFYEFLRPRGPFTVTPEYARETLRRYAARGEGHGRIVAAASIPQEYVIVQRIQLGLMALLGDLRATGDWHRLSQEWWPWADAPPSTRLAQADAAWRAGRSARGTRT